MAVAVAGFFRDIPARISVDPHSSVLLASLSFVHGHRLPGTITRSADSSCYHSVTGPVVTPTSSDVYIASLPHRALSAET